VFVLIPTEHLKNICYPQAIMGNGLYEIDDRVHVNTSGNGLYDFITCIGRHKNHMSVY